MLERAIIRGLCIRRKAARRQFSHSQMIGNALAADPVKFSLTKMFN